MIRLCTLWALLLVIVAPGRARAQLGTGGTGGINPGTMGTGLTKEDLDVTFWRVTPEMKDELLTTNEAQLFFNRAHCDCRTPVRIRTTVRQSGRVKISASTTTMMPVRVLVGFECNSGDVNVRKLCQDLGGTADIATLVNHDLWVDTTVRDLFSVMRVQAGNDSGDPCAREIQPAVWLSVESASGGTPEVVDTGVVVPGDGLEPSPPGGLTVTSGHEALELAWKSPETVADLEGYVVFCSRGESLPVFAPGTFDPDFDTTLALCGSATTTPLTATPLTAIGQQVPTGMTGSAPPRLRALDPAFVCSDLLAKGETRHRLRTLQNGIPYLVGVASVDKHGNASPLDQVVLQTPVATRDFYRGYRDAGGTAEGGLCSIAPRPGRAAMMLSLVGVPLLALWRRRRR